MVATLIGLAVGIGRLSPNWLLRKLAGWYVEMIRNVPLILQLLIWYGIVTDVLPPAAQALQSGDVFLSQRGLTLPWPEAHAGWSAALLGLVAALVVSLVLARRAAKLRDRTGRAPAVAWPSVLAFIALPVAAWAALGAPTAFTIPVLGASTSRAARTFRPNSRRCILGLSIYTAAFIAEIVRGGILAVARDRRRPRRRSGCHAGAAAAPRRAAAGAARHHPAARPASTSTSPRTARSRWPSATPTW